MPAPKLTQDPRPNPRPVPNPNGGPRTPAGKQKSRLNALRHGLTGQTVLLPGEDEQIYLTFTKQYFDTLNPQGILECQFTQTAADAQWRLNRIKSLEDAMLALPLAESEGDIVADLLAQGQTFIENSRAFANLSIYEHRLHRAHEKALRQLRDLQTAREANHKTAMEEAILLKQLDEMEERTFDPAAYGFVFSIAEITLAQRRRDRLVAAHLAQTHHFDRKKFREMTFQTPELSRAA